MTDATFKRLESKMKLPPDEIDGARVIAITNIDHRHVPTRGTTHIVAGPVDIARRLAICKYPNESRFYLFYCDENWNAATDTWHETVEGAKEQADFEYKGSRSTWENAG